MNRQTMKIAFRNNGSEWDANCYKMSEEARNLYLDLCEMYGAVREIDNFEERVYLVQYDGEADLGILIDELFDNGFVGQGEDYIEFSSKSMKCPCYGKCSLIMEVR